jgi:hypothetical protein
MTLNPAVSDSLGAALQSAAYGMVVFVLIVAAALVFVALQGARTPRHHYRQILRRSKRERKRQAQRIRSLSEYQQRKAG